MMKPIDFKAFQESLQGDAPDENWPVTLKALWFDAKDDWHTAHDLVDQLSDPMAQWIHTYFHRKEGDEWNASYWYRQAGKPFPKVSLEEEFQVLLKAVLNS